MKIPLDVKKRKDLFLVFLLARNPSQRFANTYLVYLNSTIVKDACRMVAGCESILEVTAIDTVQKVYKVVKMSQKNILHHNVYSGAVSAYLKFLSGKSLRKRVIIPFEKSQ